MSAHLLTTGWRLHQAGDLPRAEQTYRKLLEKEPANAQGWYLLGALCQARGDLTAAADHLERALNLQPAYPDALNLRGVVLTKQGCFSEAITSFREALRLTPQDAEVRTNLAVVLTHQGRHAEAVALLQAVLQGRPDDPRAQPLLRRVLSQQAAAAAPAPREAAEANDAGVDCLHQGKLDEAAACFRRALRLRAGFSEAYNNLGYTLAGQGQLAEAIACYQQALRLQPDLADAYSNLADAWHQQGNSAEAEVSYRAALRLRPELAELHHNLALTLLDQKRPVEAEASLRQAVERKPELARLHHSLGVALLEQGRWAEARVCFQQAVHLKSDVAQAHYNLATALGQLGLFGEALTSYASALRLKPDNALVHRDAALVRLLLGDFEKGLPEYEWRWKLPFFPYFPPREFSQPRWDGSSLAGRTILLYAEQGLGDTIQFIRYASLLEEQGATVIVECQRTLLRLLSRCARIDQLIAQGQPLPPHDVRAPLMSLPFHLGTRLETIPANVPYLEADAVLVKEWRKELATLSGFKIGIVWQGSTHYQHDRRRSIPLREFAPLAEVPGVRLVSLQKGPGAEQLRTVAGHWPVTDLGPRLDEQAGPFIDTAAVMKNLDLVVSVDTSIAHLAGALGVPTWLALATVPHCTWLLEREDTPWYPTMRLFRQERPGEWRPVFARMAHAVRQRMNGEAQANI
jgi:tetratricopeptide (TPR) repeat protein